MSRQSESDPPVTQRIRREPPRRGPIDHKLIAALGALSGTMLGISLTILSTDTGPLANLKVLLVTVSASLVAYGVNRFTIERGTALAAIGYPGAMIASVAAILLAGGGMFTGAYSGLVFDDVRARVLQGHGSALTAYTAAVNAHVLEAARFGPALRVVADDLQRLATCERRSSCVSGIASGGYGPVASTLHGLSSRAQAIASAFSDGEASRRQQLTVLNRLTARFQETLADETLTLADKRAKLTVRHGEIEQTVGALAETLPVGLLTAYAQELLDGVVINNHPDATRHVNDILRQHGETLVRASPDSHASIVDAPPFPALPGMVDSLFFVGEFAAFAAVIFVAELVLPLTLWVLTYTKLRWELDKHEPSAQQPVAYGVEDAHFPSPLVDAAPRKRGSRASRSIGGDR